MTSAYNQTITVAHFRRTKLLDKGIKGLKLRTQYREL